MMYSYIITHNLLFHQQSGFVRGHSTYDQLLAITNHIHENIENGNSVKAIFLDITAAFDSVPHSLLLEKLKSYGFQGPLLTLLKSYLFNRSIQVKVGNAISNSTADGFINAGIAQGSLLGPLMFLLYINDLPDDLESNTFLYADDSSLYCTINHKDIVTSLNSLQSDLKKVNTWAKTWGLQFKASKSWDITFFSPNNRPPALPDLYLDNVVIPKTSTHKHLGVILDENLTFKAHIDDLARRYQNMTNTLKSLKNTLKSRHLEKIYNTYMIPLLDHGDLLYSSSSSKFHLLKLDRIHYRAACYVSGAMRGSNTVKVLDNLNWASLSNRRKYHAGNYMYKVMSNSKPSYITNIMEKYRNPEVNNQNLRRARTFKYPPRTSYRFSNSPMISLLKLYDSFDNALKNSISLDLFKKRLHRNLFPVQNFSPTTLLALPRKNEIVINRIRVGLLLNSHRYYHNFNDTPSPACRCGNRNQDAKHILLHCTLLNHHRVTLFRSLASLGVIEHFNNLSAINKINFLLFGVKEFEIDTNKSIINSTSKFLISSKFVFKFR